jgi:ABC-type phosphate/phosphonate transport system substrate-binding protein
VIAALPMYDRPENAAAHDALWTLVREAHGGDLPAALTRDLTPAETWAHPALALGQVCGLPLRTTFRARVSYVATGTYDIDAPPGHYLSLWVVRAHDARAALAEYSGATLAINGTDSQSGWAGPVTAAAEQGVRFGTLSETGAHVLSARAVAENRADIAGIDAISWRGICRYDDAAASLRVIGATPPVPGLAFVTAPGCNTPRMFDALAAAIAALSAPHLNTLGLHGIVRIPLDAYHAVATPPTH